MNAGTEKGGKWRYGEVEREMEEGRDGEELSDWMGRDRKEQQGKERERENHTESYRGGGLRSACVCVCVCVCVFVCVYVCMCVCLLLVLCQYMTQLAVFAQPGRSNRCSPLIGMGRDGRLGCRSQRFGCSSSPCVYTR